ncbi:MAG: ArsA family ATPase [Pseudomonadales bacterium]
MAALHNSHKLVIVTGKGGVGRSLLSAALADLSVAAGLRTILVTLDTRDDRHPLLDVPLEYRPSDTGRGFAVSRVDAFQAAAEYARRNLPFGGVYGSFFQSRAFHDFAAAAPGFEELMCLGKLYDLATASEFDRVIFDAPATGHLKDLLAVPGVTQRAVRVGPLSHNARKIEDLLLDPERTHVLVATLAEEMPVREALEVVRLCRQEMRMSVGPVLVNREVLSLLSEPEMACVQALEGQGALSPAVCRALAVAHERRTLAAAQRDALRPLHEAGLEALYVPRIVQRSHRADELLDVVARYLAPLFAPLVGAPSVGAPSVGALSRGRSPAEASKSRSGDRSHGELDPFDVSGLLNGSRVVVCCGSGGVGKTTSAAALAVLAARQGKKVQVMTIDPARRLAQAMGLDSLGGEPQRVPLDAPGELWAMMLDSKHTFDRLVETYAPDPRVREAIFANHYYQQLSTSLGGSRELVAMERVLETALEGDYDLLIVDTPPSQHALDFLDAPERLVNLLDGSLAALLVRPYGLAARAQFNFFRQSSALALKFMERLTGVQMLADLSEFLLAFSSMFDGFRERSHKVQSLMRESTTSFLLICAPEPASLRQVDQFAARLAKDRMRVAGIIANRVHPAPPGEAALAPRAAVLDIGAAELAPLAECGDPAFSDLPLPERLAETWQEAVDLHVADRLALASLTAGALPLRLIPRLPRDLHSMADLEQLAALLAADFSQGPP